MACFLPNCSVPVIVSHFLHKFCISTLGYFSVPLVNCSLFSGLAWPDTINILAITRFDLGSLDVCTGLLIFDVVSINT